MSFVNVTFSPETSPSASVLNSYTPYPATASVTSRNSRLSSITKSFETDPVKLPPSAASTVYVYRPGAFSTSAAVPPLVQPAVTSESRYGIPGSNLAPGSLFFPS